MADNAAATVELVRSRYAAAAAAVIADSKCGSGCCSGAAAAIEVDESFGAGLYDAADTAELPEQALLASLGCGNPTAVADLHPGERVLDLGSGGGIDVLLSARRVGPTGFAYGVDMTEEMLDLARENAAKAGAGNVEFLAGRIEAVPLPDGAVDVVISNCVINLSTDKPAVLAEMFRVLAPGGRLGISDVVADDGVTAAERAERGTWIGCVAGALSRSEYLQGLTAAGFTTPSVEFTHEVAAGMHGAIVRAVKPAGHSSAATTQAATTAPPSTALPATHVAATVVPAVGCCDSAELSECCAPSAKTSCCGAAAAGDTGVAAPATCSCR